MFLPSSQSFTLKSWLRMLPLFPRVRHGTDSEISHYNQKTHLRKTCPDNLFHFVITACSDYRLIADKMTMLAVFVTNLIFIFVDTFLSFLLFIKSKWISLKGQYLATSIQWYVLLKMPAEFLAPVRWHFDVLWMFFMQNNFYRENKKEVKE